MADEKFERNFGKPRDQQTADQSASKKAPSSLNNTKDINNINESQMTNKDDPIPVDESKLGIPNGLNGNYGKKAPKKVTIQEEKKDSSD